MDNEEIKNDLKYAFENLVEFHVRNEKKWYRDRIYRGVFHKTLIQEGFLQKQLKIALDEGFIEEHKIIDENGSQRLAYLWIEREMPQREPFKRLIDRIYRLFLGEYSEYY